MKGTEMIQWLKRLEKNTLGIVCSGCGHEHNCAQQGCAVAKAVKGYIEVTVQRVGICDICKHSRAKLPCWDTEIELECDTCKERCVCGLCAAGENFDFDEEKYG